MSTTKDFTENDVLVLFPASKNFEKLETLNNPIKNLFDEAPAYVDVIEKRRVVPHFNFDFEDQLTLAHITSALEVRLNLLCETKDRLKFYLDDLELELSKK